jgi:hypothetical protein
MLNYEDVYITISDYLLKLKQLIGSQAYATWFKTRIISKKRIDDILCCIEGSFPEEYKNYVKVHGSTSLGGFKAYQKLIASIRRRVFLNSESYAVLYEEALLQIRNFQSGLKLDLKRVCESDNNMF